MTVRTFFAKETCHEVIISLTCCSLSKKNHRLTFARCLSNTWTLRNNAQGRYTYTRLRNIVNRQHVLFIGTFRVETGNTQMLTNATFVLFYFFSFTVKHANDTVRVTY